MVTSVHQHDAPVADLEAQRILERHNAIGKICDLEFHERAVQRVAAALREGLKAPRKVTQIGIGQAKVEKVASNRRFLDTNGKISFARTSSTRDPQARAAPENTIDPFLKTLSFWDGERPVLAMSCYATHPMSYYGRGGVSADFVGMARARRQKDDETTCQIYVSGCSGNVTAGKYNDGSTENRPILANRIYQAMVAAWQDTQRHPLGKIAYRVAPLRLEPRTSAGFSIDELNQTIAAGAKPNERVPGFAQCLAALGLSWRKRTDAGHHMDVPVADFGVAQLLLLPAESYVELQLFAQQMHPDSFVVTMGYGECAPGYIPTEQAFAEGDTNLRDWCWVAPGAERTTKAAIEAALKR